MCSVENGAAATTLHCRLCAASAAEQPLQDVTAAEALEAQRREITAVLAIVGFVADQLLFSDLVSFCSWMDC